MNTPDQLHPLLVGRVYFHGRPFARHFVGRTFWKIPRQGHMTCKDGELSFVQYHRFIPAVLASMLNIWRPVMRRWLAPDDKAKTLSYAFYRCNLQLRRRLTTRCGSASSFCCVPKSFKSVAPFTTALVLSRPSSSLCSAATRINVIPSRRSTVSAGTDSSGVVRSITTVRGDGERHVRMDRSGGMGRLRQPKRLNR